jgi:hypothetical protein
MRYNFHTHKQSYNQVIIKLKVCVFLVFSTFLINCHNNIINEKLKEGSILYDITYFNTSDRNFPPQFLPNTMELKFNKNYASYTIEDRVGLFSISNITDLKKHSHLTLIKVFNKKYAYKGTRSEIPVFFEASASTYYVNFLPDTLKLAGISCKRASVTDTKSHKNYDIAYTSNIAVANPNENTPYKDIDGLLMKFVLQMKNLRMVLTAKKYEKKQTNDKEFIIPEGYKFITKKQMEEIITTLLP